MQRLAAEKVHGTEGFEKHRGRRRHPPLHYGIRHPFKQREIFKGEHLGLGFCRKGVGESSTDFAPRLKKRCLGEGDHKCVERQLKTLVETYYMKGLEESQLR